MLEKVTKPHSLSSPKRTPTHSIGSPLAIPKEAAVTLRLSSEDSGGGRVGGLGDL